MPGEIYITASSGISQHRVFKNQLPAYDNPDADMPGFLMAAYHHFGIKYPKFYKMDHLCKLGWLASEVLLKDSFDELRYQPEEMGIILANASSSLDADLKYFESTKEFASPALFVYTLPNIVIGEICIKHKFKGENAFFIFEAFDADFMEKYVRNLINSNILQACICGWVELIGEEYRAVLFLVEKARGPGDHEPEFTQQGIMLFTQENLNKIYHLENG
ncbi:MAG: hypothetical protein H7Z13_07735 [Ferruginibacter sp.]|nr:hypothetical protein [Ferruginibacter sp.]